MVDIEGSTLGIAHEIAEGRNRAHSKHGANSIESHAPMAGAWLPILIEEVGELAHEMTYDAQIGAWGVQTKRLNAMRRELVDVSTVAVAWIASIDRALEYINRVP